MSTVLFELVGGAAKITLNRPEVFNALNSAMVEELATAIKQCVDPTIRVVVITGAGKAFCSGGDLKEMHAVGSERLPDFLRDMIKPFHRLITDIRMLPKPVIAAVNGQLAGVGFSMALACDLRFAVEQVKFKQSYTSVGLSPDGGFTAFLPAIVGLAKTSELLFLDPIIDAAQAKEFGIVHDVFGEEEFADRVSEIAAKLASGPTLSFARAKSLLNSALLSHLERQLELERQGMIAAGRTGDALEGITAFFEKRSPNYSGE